MTATADEQAQAFELDTLRKQQLAQWLSSSNPRKH